MVNAGKILSARTKSKVAQENMDVFRDAWINQVIYFSIDILSHIHIVFVMAIRVLEFSSGGLQN